MKFLFYLFPSQSRAEDYFHRTPSIFMLNLKHFTCVIRSVVCHHMAESDENEIWQFGTNWLRRGGGSQRRKEMWCETFRLDWTISLSLSILTSFCVWIAWIKWNFCELQKNSHQSKQREISNLFQSFMNACDAILEEKWNKNSFC